MKELQAPSRLNSLSFCLHDALDTFSIKELVPYDRAPLGYTTRSERLCICRALTKLGTKYIGHIRILSSHHHHLADISAL